MALMAKHAKFKAAFESLGIQPLSPEIYDTLEEFTCCMYGYRQHKRVNDALKACFDKKCKINTTGKPLAAIKSVDPTSFLPCKRVLYEQIKRTWYVAHLYKTASDPYPAIDATLIDYGFKLTPDKEYICINWFEGDRLWI